MRSPIRSALLVLAAAGFVLYPLLRGFGPETGLAGAEHFASVTWVVAHLAAMVGFVTIALVLRGDAWTPRDGGGGAGRRTTELLAWLSASALLPYYGAEAFGLNAMGKWVEAGGTPSAVDIADDFRFAPTPLVVFAVGWILLGWAAVRLVLDHRTGARLERWGVGITSAMLVLFLPQFFAPGPVRIAHGVVLGLGLMMWAVSTAATADTRPTRSAS
ncbi:hypothetical protein [Gordonia soli]|uniref:Uncharacterized protein n=1 Tax=Gordonia soli NBRC 108243 TaxID=1223545 RepID=M0QKJ9_9ACTN|nr:hypothetical protein [Gordonia soli]GAC67942.1 hypothetical protein GS4_11_02110 [Gordonia soli NBRC 108243]